MCPLQLILNTNKKINIHFLGIVKIQKLSKYISHLLFNQKLIFYYLLTLNKIILNIFLQFKKPPYLPVRKLLIKRFAYLIIQFSLTLHFDSKKDILSKKEYKYIIVIHGQLLFIFFLLRVFLANGNIMVQLISRFSFTGSLQSYTLCKHDRSVR